MFFSGKLTVQIPQKRRQSKPLVNAETKPLFSWETLRTEKLPNVSKLSVCVFVLEREKRSWGSLILECLDFRGTVSKKNTLADFSEGLDAEKTHVSARGE